MNILIAGALLAATYLAYQYFFSQSVKTLTPKESIMTAEWKQLLEEHVDFYAFLKTSKDKELFEFKVLEFLANSRVTGVDTEVEDLDRLLVAASAIIPIFAFPNWVYHDLEEVLIYPTSFNEYFQTDGPDRRILGMVGTGYMEGKMILSKEALRHGFQNEHDKKNTAIHEFIHLIDKADGVIDGIPELLLEKQYILPWFDLIDKKIEKINKGKTDINPYGGTSRIEFFAVLGEYFFERPKLLEKQYPTLYKMLQKMFKYRIPNKKRRRKNKNKVGRNDPCHCGSGRKNKRCCK